MTRRSSVTVSITVFLAGSARRKSPAVARNPLVSAVMNQLIGPWFHPGRVGTDRAGRTSGTGRGAGAAMRPTLVREAAEADAALGVDLYQVLARRRRGHGLLAGQRGQRAADGTVRGARPDRGRTGPGAAPRRIPGAAGRRGHRPAADAAGRGDGGPGGGSAIFRAPGTVWIQSGLRLGARSRPGWHGAVTLAGADFAAAPEAARAEINRVIAEQTEGKITGLLPSGTVTALTRLVLASAVYLKAAWTDPFPERATGDAPFYPDGPDGPALAVPMMRGTAPRAYLRGDGYQAVLLPYRDIGLAMAVLLPDGPLAALRPKLAAAGLGGLLAGTARHQVTLSLPRFRLEAAFDLIPALRRLGVIAAFGDDADFSEHHRGRAAADRRGGAQGLHRRRRAGHRGGGGHRGGDADGGRHAAAAAGHDGRGPAVPVRDHRHRDRPAGVPRPGQPPGRGVIRVPDDQRRGSPAGATRRFGASRAGRPDGAPPAGRPGPARRSPGRPGRARPGRRG